MKTTVRTGKESRFVVKPTPLGVMVCHEVHGVYGPGWQPHHTFELTPDQAGAFMFGMEQALEVGDVAAERAAVVCSHARICAQEGECASGCTQRLWAIL